MTELREVSTSDGVTVKLASYTYDRGDHVDTYTDIMVRTRTGKKVHRGSDGSSVTCCGVWLRSNGSYFKVDPARVHSAQLCDHPQCFGR